MRDHNTSHYYCHYYSRVVIYATMFAMKPLPLSFCHERDCVCNECNVCNDARRRKSERCSVSKSRATVTTSFASRSSMGLASPSTTSCESHYTSSYTPRHTSSDTTNDTSNCVTSVMVIVGLALPSPGGLAEVLRAQRHKGQTMTKS